MSPGGEEVSPLNIAGWRSFPLRARLAALTGLPTFVDNDAKALALGEGWVGAAAGYDDYIAMVVSTGVGGGIVLDGRLLNGRLGNAGHIGHIVVVPDGRACPCGSRGCLEAEASGTALAALTGQPARLASAEWVARTGMLVGRAMATVAVLLDLSLAVVSGSVALGFGEPFFAAAQAEMDQLCRISFARGAQVVPGGLGDDGPLVGRGPGGPVRGGGGGMSVAVATGLGPGRPGRAARSGPDPGSGGPRPAPCAAWPGGAGGTGPPSSRCPGMPTGTSASSPPTAGRARRGQLTPDDVLAYVRWCQRSRPRRG